MSKIRTWIRFYIQTTTTALIRARLIKRQACKKTNRQHKAEALVKPSAQHASVILNYSNEREINLSCLRQHVPDALRKLQLGKGKQTFKILSIGAGDGYMDHEMFKIVKEEYLNGENQLEDVKIGMTAIEPHQEYEAQYKQHFETPSRQGTVQVEFRSETFQSYMQSQEFARNQYDLIQTIHSIYFLRPLESTLKHCYDQELGDKGLIVCVVAGEDCIYNMVREGLNKNRHDQKVRQPLRAAENIVNLAMKNRWDFSQFHCPITIDVTGIVKELTEDGKVLFDFMTKEINFFDKADQESVDAVLEKLKEISTEEDDGRMTVKEGNELFLIYYINPQKNR